MKAYNPKDWHKVVLNMGKADTISRLKPLLIFIAIYSAFIAFLELEFLNLSEHSWLKNIPMMHNLLGFAISMLLVFRTNTAYDRWWEGRKLWGSLVNNSRNLAIKMNVMLDKGDIENREFFRKTIPLYAQVLKAHLQSDVTRLSLDEMDHPELGNLALEKHMPNQIACLILERANKLYKEGSISGDQLIVINAELQSFTDICGACERIKNTPIPYSYSAFIKKFIFIYVLTLPLGYVFSMGYLVIPVVTFIFYVLASLELVAEEIEDPFGNDDNDLPMDKIASNINKHIGEILQ